MTGVPIDPDVIELAGRVFDLARGADPARTNDRGQTALAAAVFRQSTDSVSRLLAAGADPDAGGPSARATSTFFRLPAMSELLEESGRSG